MSPKVNSTNSSGPQGSSPADSSMRATSVCLGVSSHRPDRYRRTGHFAPFALAQYLSQPLATQQSHVISLKTALRNSPGYPPLPAKSPWYCCGLQAWEALPVPIRPILWRYVEHGRRCRVCRHECCLAYSTTWTSDTMIWLHSESLAGFTPHKTWGPEILLDHGFCLNHFVIQRFCLLFIPTPVQLDCIICWFQGLWKIAEESSTASPDDEDVVKKLLIQLNKWLKSGIFQIPIWEILIWEILSVSWRIQHRPLKRNFHGSPNMLMVDVTSELFAFHIHICEHKISSLPAWGRGPSESSWGWYYCPWTTAKQPFLSPVW
jgi:hypothetical protein